MFLRAPAYITFTASLYSVGARRDQEGPGHFYDLTFLVKSVSQCEYYFMPYCDIAEIERPDKVLVTVSDSSLLCINSPHLPPHHFKECQNQPPVTTDNCPARDQAGLTS